MINFDKMTEDFKKEEKKFWKSVEFKIIFFSCLIEYPLLILLTILYLKGVIL